MEQTPSARINVEDLPELEHLTEEEKAAIFGAGRAQLGIEALETRELMATNLMASLSAGALRVEGTPNAETIRLLESNGQISVEGIPIQTGSSSVGSVGASAVQRIVVDGMAGDDHVWINFGSGTLTPALEVAGSAGRDVLHSLGATRAIGLGDGVLQTAQLGNKVYSLASDGRLLVNGTELATNVTAFAAGNDGNAYYFQQGAVHRVITVTGAQSRLWDGVRSFTPIAGGRIWIDLGSNGLRLFDPVAGYPRDYGVVQGFTMANTGRAFFYQGSAVYYVDTNGVATNSANAQRMVDGVKSFTPLADGRIWIDQGASGLRLFDPTAGYSRDYGVVQGFTMANTGRAFFYQGSAVYYVDTNGVATNSANAQRMVDGVKSFTPLADGRIWIDQGASGLRLFDPAAGFSRDFGVVQGFTLASTGRGFFYQNGSAYYVDIAGVATASVSPRTLAEGVKSFRPTADGRIWIDRTDGLFLYDPVQTAWCPFGVAQGFTLASTGRAFFYRNGSAYYVDIAGVATASVSPRTLADGVKTFTPAADGRIWIYRTDGLFLYDPVQTAWCPFGVAQGFTLASTGRAFFYRNGSAYYVDIAGVATASVSPRTLADGVKTFTPAADGRIWIYRTDGLFLYDPVQTAWCPFGVAQGFTLASTGRAFFYQNGSAYYVDIAGVATASVSPRTLAEGVKSFRPTADGRIWIDRTDGLFLYDPVQTSWRNFGVAQGFTLADARQVNGATFLLDLDGGVRYVAADGATRKLWDRGCVALTPFAHGVLARHSDGALFSIPAATGVASPLADARQVNGATFLLDPDGGVRYVAADGATRKLWDRGYVALTPFAHGVLARHSDGTLFSIPAANGVPSPLADARQVDGATFLLDLDGGVRYVAADGATHKLWDRGYVALTPFAHGVLARHSDGALFSIPAATGVASPLADARQVNGATFLLDPDGGVRYVAADGATRKLWDRGYVALTPFAHGVLARHSDGTLFSIPAANGVPSPLADARQVDGATFLLDLDGGVRYVAADGATHKLWDRGYVALTPFAHGVLARHSDGALFSIPAATGVASPLADARQVNGATFLLDPDGGVRYVAADGATHKLWDRGCVALTPFAHGVLARHSDGALFSIPATNGVPSPLADARQVQNFVDLGNGKAAYLLSDHRLYLLDGSHGGSWYQENDRTYALVSLGGGRAAKLLNDHVLEIWDGSQWQINNARTYALADLGGGKAAILLNDHTLDTWDGSQWSQNNVRTHAMADLGGGKAAILLDDHTLEIWNGGQWSQNNTRTYALAGLGGGKAAILLNDHTLEIWDGSRWSVDNTRTYALSDLGGGKAAILLNDGTAVLWDGSNWASASLDAFLQAVGGQFTVNGFTLSGDIAHKWLELGGVQSSVGLPVGPVFSTSDGLAQHFQNGGIFQIASTGEVLVIGDAALWQRYLREGGEAGPLGLPTTNGLDFGGGWWGHQFQHGTVFVRGQETQMARGFNLSGDIARKWLALGGESSSLGLPTGNQPVVLTGGAVITFERGALYWQPGAEVQKLNDGSGFQILAAATDRFLQSLQDQVDSLSEPEREAIRASYASETGLSLYNPLEDLADSVGAIPARPPALDSLNAEELIGRVEASLGSAIASVEGVGDWMRDVVSTVKDFGGRFAEAGHLLSRGNVAGALGGVLESVGLLARDLVGTTLAAALNLVADSLTASVICITSSRRLTDDEVALGRSIFGVRINLENVRICIMQPGYAKMLEGRAHVHGQVMYFPESPDLTNPKGRGKLAHELTHVFQDQNVRGGSTYQAIREQSRVVGETIAYAGTVHDYKPYECHLDEASLWGDLGAEQQGQVVENFQMQIDWNAYPGPETTDPDGRQWKAKGGIKYFSPISTAARVHYERVLQEARLFHWRVG